MKIYQAHPAFILNRQAIISSSILLYLQMHQPTAAPVLLSSISLSNADSGDKNTGSGSSTTGAGNAGAGHTSGSDDDNNDISNPGADLIKNTGDDIRISDFEGSGINGAPKPEAGSATSENDTARMEAEAASPGGTGENRIVGGNTNEDIDWEDIVDEGTGEADAATS